MKIIIIGIFFFSCFGCSDSRLNIRPVHDSPSLYVGLTSSNDPEKLTQVHYTHPMVWSEGNLRAILEGLFIQKQGGLLDAVKPLEVVFSPEDITQLIPALRSTFKVARPSDLVVFALWGSSQPSQTLEVTSGGMFLHDQRFHIILANHRERVSSEKDGIEGIHSNPFRSLRDDKKGQLIFDPLRYMIDSRDNWLAGGYNSPASEIILDLQALLATDRPVPTINPQNHSAQDSSETDSSSGLSTESEVKLLREEISNLKGELSRLQHLITQQAEEISQQKNP